MIDRAYIKYLAKQSMKGRKPSVYLVALVFLVITNILSELSTKIQIGNTSIDEIWEDMSQGISFVPPELSFGGSLLLIAIALMSAVLTVGFQGYCMRVSRKQDAGIGDIFDVFSFFKKAVALSFMTGLFIILWSLLLVVPGIIAAYRYSFAPYILLDTPSKGVLQCIRESKELTAGYKGKLFVLDLSFIGWEFLASVPALLAGVSPIIAIAGSILISAFVTPYRTIATAMYYNRLSGWITAPED